MAKRRHIFKCEVCGHIIEVIHDGAGTLVCCDQPMVLQDEKTADSATEKHVPVIEKIAGGVKVTVGSVPHPMEEKHYIEWIELTADGVSCKRFLEPSDPPEATFRTDAKNLAAREYCNVHSLWKG